jgi:hypothetical protein
MEMPRWAGRVTAAVVVGAALIIRRALQDAASRSDAQDNAPRNEMNWHWRCECGAQSRGGDIKADTVYNAQRHQWRKGTGHSMPEVYPEPS